MSQEPNFAHVISPIKIASKFNTMLELSTAVYLRVGTQETMTIKHSNPIDALIGIQSHREIERRLTVVK